MEKDVTRRDKLTITLTDRRPVRIDRADWPILARGADKEFDNQYEFQANHISRWALQVRQHADGRAVVYAVYTHDTSNGDDSRSYRVRGGVLLTPSDDLPAAVRRVGEWARAQEHAYEEDAARWEGVIRDCIADLPAEDI